MSFKYSRHIRVRVRVNQRVSADLGCRCACREALGLADFSQLLRADMRAVYGRSAHYETCLMRYQKFDDLERHAVLFGRREQEWVREKPWLKNHGEICPRVKRSGSWRDAR